MSNNPTSGEREEIVPVNWDEKDLRFVAFQLEDGNITEEEALASPQLSISSITTTEIQRFCAGCQNLGEKGVCLFGQHDQARYVARKWCGWAKRDGKAVS